MKYRGIKMGYLAGKKLYLSGAIEHAKPQDNWRVEPMHIFKEWFDIDVFDPNSDPKQQWFSPLVEAKQNRDFDKMAYIAKRFVRKDLQIVQKANIVVAYLPKDVRTTGTHHEIIAAEGLKIPTLLVSEHKEEIPLWYYGFIDHKYMFDGWANLYDYLREVDEGNHKDDFLWAFVYELI